MLLRFCNHVTNISAPSYAGRISLFDLSDTSPVYMSSVFAGYMVTWLQLRLKRQLAVLVFVAKKPDTSVNASIDPFRDLRSAVVDTD